MEIIRIYFIFQYIGYDFFTSLLLYDFYYDFLRVILYISSGYVI